MAGVLDRQLGLRASLSVVTVGECLGTRLSFPVLTWRKYYHRPRPLVGSTVQPVLAGTP